MQSGRQNNYIGLVFTVLLLTATLSEVQACAISPAYQISEYPGRYLERYNSLFLGKIVGVENPTTNTQIIDFKVIEVLKGELEDNVRVTNVIESNCSMYFGKVGSSYYVFGNIDTEGKAIQINGFPSFVSKEYAVESGMLQRLKGS